MSRTASARLAAAGRGQILAMIVILLLCLPLLPLVALGLFIVWLPEYVSRAARKAGAPWVR